MPDTTEGSDPSDIESLGSDHPTPDEPADVHPHDPAYDQRIEGEGEGQWRRFAPDSVDHHPDLSGEDPPPPRGGNISEAFVELFNPNMSEAEIDDNRRAEQRSARAEVEAEADLDNAGSEPEAEWQGPAGVPTVLPDGSEIVLPDTEFEASDGVLHPSSNTKKRALAIAAGLGAVAVLVVLLLLFNGDAPESASAAPSVTQPTTEEPLPGLDEDPPGESSAEPVPPEGAEDGKDTEAQSSAAGTTTDFADDAVGDLTQAFPDLDSIDSDRSDGGITGKLVVDTIDIVGVAVTTTAPAGPTIIAIAFNGDVESVLTETLGTLRSRTVSADVLLIAPNGNTLNVLFKPDGSIKISDIPTGMSIASAWVAPDSLRIVIQGLALEPGTQVDVVALIEAYGGIMMDEASLTTTGL
jgi:hypothetical protein